MKVVNKISNDRIKELYSTGKYTYSQLGKMRKVSRERIRQILNNNDQSHLYKRIYIKCSYTKDGKIKARRMFEHRYVMEKHLGRKLKREEEICRSKSYIYICKGSASINNMILF